MHNAHRGFVVYSPKLGRCERVLTDLQECQRQGLLLPHQAEKVLGWLGFVTHSSILGGVGRAPTLPFYHQAYKQSLNGLSSDLFNAWADWIDHTLVLLHALFYKDKLPH